MVYSKKGKHCFIHAVMAIKMLVSLFRCLTAVSVNKHSLDYLCSNEHFNKSVEIRDLVVTNGLYSTYLICRVKKTHKLELEDLN